MQPTEPSGEARISGLDGLRGIAVLLVIAFHAQRLLAGRVVLVPIDMGWCGVDLFFVLSGFLITGILRRTREQPRFWRNFAIRRALRIVPVYYMLLALILVPRALTGVPSEGPWWIYPTFLSNFWIGRHEGTDLTLDITWSLSVEEQFYVTWPLAVWLLDRRRLALLCGVLIVAAPLFRYALHEPGTDVAYTWTPCRMDSLAWGALACLVREGAAEGPRWAWARAGGVLVVPLALGLCLVGDPRSMFPFAVAGYSVLNSVFAGFVVGVADRRWPRLVEALDHGPLARLGIVSYGAYLLHPLWIVGLTLTPIPWWLGLPLSVALTWASAALVWRTVEAPILGFKGILAPYGGASPTAAGRSG